MPRNFSKKPNAHRSTGVSPERRRGIEGIVLEALPAANFRIKISPTEEVIGYLAGKMRMYYIKVLPGDRVLVELSDDRKRGRITRRL